MSRIHVSHCLSILDGKLKKIYERIPEGSDHILKGAETTVVFDNDGTMYALTEEAKLVHLTDFIEEEGSPVITAKVIRTSSGSKVCFRR